MTKIAVYAICKNEEKFVERWIKSMSEADAIYVLDTGSNDNTVEKLKQNDVIVKQKIINPWRFDVARNESLQMVDQDVDICVCTDLDEVFNEGWREQVELLWQPDTDSMKYNLNCSFDSDGKPGMSLYIEKIHTRDNFKWTYPIHEVLEFTGQNKKTVICDTININHYPDQTKSRGQYLPLLEMSVKELPDDDRVWHYLGREYMYYQKWNECIDTLIHHLNLPSAVWKEERCASMRFISRAYIALNRYDEAKMWLEKAILEAPHLREPFAEYGKLEYSLNNYKKATQLLEQSLKIKERSKTYINEPFCFDSTIPDILSVCYYNLNNKQKAYQYVLETIKLEPNNERIQNNKKIIEQMKEH